MSGSSAHPNNEEEVYEVEFVSAACTDFNGAHEYLVHWAGYTDDEDSWEIASNLKGCERLLTSFWAAVDDICANTSDIHAIAPVAWRKAESKSFGRSIGSHSETKMVGLQKQGRLLSHNSYRNTSTYTQTSNGSEFFVNGQYNELVNDDIDSSSEPEILSTTEQRSKNNQQHQVTYSMSQPDEMAISSSDFISTILKIANAQSAGELLQDQFSSIDSGNMVDYSGDNLSLNKMAVQWSWSTKICLYTSAASSFQSSDITMNNYSKKKFPEFLSNISKLVPEKLYSSSQAMAILAILAQKLDPILTVCPMRQNNISQKIELLYLYLKATNSVGLFTGATNNFDVKISKFFVFASDSIIGSYMQQSKLSIEAEDEYIGIFILPSHSSWMSEGATMQLYKLVPKDFGLLRLLPDFINFMKNKTFCIWSNPVDPLPSRAGCKFSLETSLETSTLLHILEQSNARNKGYNEINTQVVFVHLGALYTIGRLNQLVERRQSQLDVSFILYGSSPHYAPSEWRMREIYIIGGIAAFTPSVFLENPTTAINIIQLIHSHPLWIAYISFSTIGLLEYLLQKGEIKYGLYKIDLPKLRYTLSRIYLLAQQGQVLLLNKVPPSNSHNSANISEWIETQFKLQNIEQTQQMILYHFKSFYNNMSGSELFKAHMIEKELMHISYAMQIKGIFMEKYRRFVIFKGSTEAYLLNNFLSGIEWCNIDECPW